MTDTATASPGPAPARRWRWLLIASLALNLVFIGGLGALWVKGPPPGHGPMGSSQTAFGLMRFSRDLPPERRDAVRKHLKDARQQLKGLRTELRAARQKAAEIVASASYTPEQLKAAMDAVSSTESRMRDAGAAALQKAVSDLTLEERQKLSEAWMRRLERPQRRRGKPDKDEPPDAPDGPPDPP